MSLKRYELDSVYFRIKRGEKYDNICFSDLTQDEQLKVIEDWSARELARLLDIINKETIDLCLRYADECPDKIDRARDWLKYKVIGHTTELRLFAEQAGVREAKDLP